MNTKTQDFLTGIKMIDFDLVLLCAGKGERFGARKSKCLIEFEVADTDPDKEYKTQPLWWITYKNFVQFNPKHVFLVIPREDSPMVWFESIPQTYIPTNLRVVTGGSSRHQSLKNALKDCFAEYVMIHDGCRPFATQNLIKELIFTAEKYPAMVGGVIPFIPCDSTVLRDTHYSGHKITPREDIKLLQTPQLYKTEKLRQAYERFIPHGHADDLTVYSQSFNDWMLIEGERQNIKLTYPEDKVLFESRFKNEKTS